LLKAWDCLNATIELRSRMLQDAETLSKWCTWLHHTLTWITSSHNIIVSAQKHENQEIEVHSDGQHIVHVVGVVEEPMDLSFEGLVNFGWMRLMNQHKQVWDEICACEVSIQSHCEEGTTAINFHGVLETDDFTTMSTFFDIHKMLAKSVAQLQADLCDGGLTNEGGVASDVQKAAFTSLCEVKPLRPSHFMKSAAALLIVHFYRLKVAWWRYWRHLEALSAKLDLLRDIQNFENWLTSMEEGMDTRGLGSSLEETMALTDKHREFSRSLALQGEKYKRLAEFEMGDAKPLEDAPLERMEGALHHKVRSQRRLSGVKGLEHWEKCYALLKPTTTSLHVLNLGGPPTAKRSWPPENSNAELRLPLFQKMAATLVEQSGVDSGVFKIHNPVTGEYHDFKARTHV
uniref:Spindle pole body component n=1 Tax=Hydatigena taeniaeformis TaxID=6205 RepID=A0A0R3XAQ3_HYDTA